MCRCLWGKGQVKEMRFETFPEDYSWARIQYITHILAKQLDAAFTRSYHAWFLRWHCVWGVINPWWHAVSRHHTPAVSCIFALHNIRTFFCLPRSNSVWDSSSRELPTIPDRLPPSILTSCRVPIPCDHLPLRPAIPVGSEQHNFRVKGSRVQFSWFHAA